MAGPNKFSPPCGCCGTPPCGTPVNITVTVRCQTSAFGYSSITTGVTVTLKDSGGATVATDAATPFVVAAPSAGDYTVEVSKTGYRTETTSITVVCGVPQSITVTIALESITLTVTVGYACLVGQYFQDVDVDITGDATDSGTTNSSGQVVFTINLPAGQTSAALTIAGTPPTGYGAASASTTVTLYFCSATASASLSINPASGHVAQTCSGRFLPDSLDYSDDYGTCTLTWNGSSRFEGSYTYGTTDGISRIDCDGILTCVAGQSLTVTVLVYLSTNCYAAGTTNQLSLSREVRCGAGRSECDIVTTVRRVVITTETNCSAFNTQATPSPAYNVSCASTAISWTVPLAYTTYSIPEVSSITADVTGTI